MDFLISFKPNDKLFHQKVEKNVIKEEKCSSGILNNSVN